MSEQTSKTQQESVPAKARLGWMDTLRGIAVLLVVFEHAVLLAPNDPSLPFVAFAQAMAPFRIPALMFLSGLLLSRSLAKPPRRYLRGKIDRILWPYLLWSILLFVMTTISYGPMYLVGELINPTSPMWYVGYLFVFYVVALALPAAARSWSVPFAFILAALSNLGTAGTLLTEVRETNLQRFFFTMAVFFAGDFVARHRERVLPMLRRRLVLIPSALLTLAALGVSGAGWIVRYQPLWILPTLAGIIVAIPLAEAFSRTRGGMVAGALGRNSMVYYLAHWPVQIVCWHAVVAVGIDNGNAIMAANLLAALVACAALTWLTRRSRWVNLLFNLRPGPAPAPSGRSSWKQGALTT